MLRRDSNMRAMAGAMLVVCSSKGMGTVAPAVFLDLGGYRVIGGEYFLVFWTRRWYM